MGKHAAAGNQIVIIPTERYLEQLSRWPSSGMHILAHFDERTIIVYQAYCPATGLFAARNGFFGDGFSYNRMSWIKPNFLWMILSAELELAAWVMRGKKRWSMFVEPPWEYTVAGGLIHLDVMGAKSSFSIATGPSESR